MPRLFPIDAEHAEPAAAALLEGVRKKLGMTPNLMATLAHSPAALSAYLGFGQTLAGGALDDRLREQIALAIAGANACEYCASAHTALGKGQGVTDAELALNLQGESSELRTRAALTLARAIVVKRGLVTDDDVRVARDAGFSDGELVEIVAVVALNIFTNYFNHLAETEVDFPHVAVGEMVNT